jgi:hypothetical protein
MPHSPHARNKMTANAPKPSQQSRANRSKGTKTRHMDSSPGVSENGGGGKHEAPRFCLARSRAVLIPNAMRAECVEAKEGYRHNC